MHKPCLRSLLFFVQVLPVLTSDLRSQRGKLADAGSFRNLVLLATAFGKCHIHQGQLHSPSRTMRGAALRWGAREDDCDSAWLLARAAPPDGWQFWQAGKRTWGNLPEPPPDSWQFWQAGKRTWGNLPEARPQTAGNFGNLANGLGGTCRGEGGLASLHGAPCQVAKIAGPRPASLRAALVPGCQNCRAGAGSPTQHPCQVAKIAGPRPASPTQHPCQLPKLPGRGWQASAQHSCLPKLPGRGRQASAQHSCHLGWQD